MALDRLEKKKTIRKFDFILQNPHKQSHKSNPLKIFS
jgi:hypothetical protein